MSLQKLEPFMKINMEAGIPNVLAVADTFQLSENANINSKFKVGQVVRFRNYKRNAAEKEAYFVVICEASAENEMVLYTLTTNRLFPCGSTVIPEFPEEDLRHVDLKPEDLLQKEVFMYQKPDESILTGSVVNYVGEEEFITFYLEDSFLVSNMKVDYHTSDDLFMRGNILIGLYY
jgi:hypothetical protein